MIGSRLVVLLYKRLSDLFLVGVGISGEPPTQPGLEFTQERNRLHFTVNENCRAWSATEVTGTYVSGLRDLTIDELLTLTLEELEALEIYGYYDAVEVPGFGIAVKQNRFHFTMRK